MKQNKFFQGHLFLIHNRKFDLFGKVSIMLNIQNILLITVLNLAQFEGSKRYSFHCHKHAL